MSAIRERLAELLWLNPGGNIALVLLWGGVVLGLIYCSSAWGVAVSIVIAVAISWPGSERAARFCRRIGMEWNDPPSGE